MELDSYIVRKKAKKVYYSVQYWSCIPILYEKNDEE